MQRLALVWLVMELTGSTGKMGLMELTNQCPIFFIGVFIGVFLDRYDLRKILMATQVAMITHSLCLAFLIHIGAVSYASLLALSLLLGIITSIDMPARQASIVQMIDHSGQLQSALSLQSGSFNLARLIGPAVAGFVINLGGEVACFILNAVAHLAVLYAYWRMKLPPRNRPYRFQPASEALREGLRYIQNTAPIRLTTLFNFAFCFAAVPYVVLLPIFTREILGGDARLLGFLMAGVGLGGLAGVFHLANNVVPSRLAGYIWRMQALFGFSFSLFALSGDWRLSLLLAPVVGFAIITSLVANNSLIQALVDEDKRGRVLSIYTLGLLGFGPLGAFVMGKLADMFDPRLAALVCGLFCLCTGLVHRRKQKLYAQDLPILLAGKGLD